MIYVVYGKESCPWCVRAKDLLESKGLEYVYKQLGVDYQKEQLMELVPTARTLPQVFVVVGNDFTHIGGFDQLKEELENV